MRNKDVSEEQIGPGQRPARAGGDTTVLKGRPRSTGSALQRHPSSPAPRAKLCSLKAGSEETRV